MSRKRRGGKQYRRLARARQAGWTGDRGPLPDGMAWVTYCLDPQECGDDRCAVGRLNLRKGSN
jgi:hypothetical protein